MATRIWLGDAPAIAQVNTLTVGGTIEVGDEFNVTINGKTVQVAADSTVAAEVADQIVAAIASSPIPEFQEVTPAATSGGALTLTSRVPGRPFAVSVTTTEAGGGAADDQTFGSSATVANSGPAVWSVAANWSGGAVPVNGDNVVIENTNRSILYGLNQSAVTLDSLTIRKSFTGTIGLPRSNPAGYVEYRDQYLAIGADAVEIGQGDGAGSSRIKLDSGSTETALAVYGAGASQSSEERPLTWKGTHSDNTLLLQAGSMAIAPEAGETAVLNELSIGYRQNQASDVDLWASAGTTISAMRSAGGVAVIEGDVATLVMTAGDVTLRGPGGATLILVNGGTCHYESTGTITGVGVSAGGTLDFSRDRQGREVTTCTATAGATIRDPLRTVDWAGGIDLPNIGLHDVTLELGDNINLAATGL